MRIIKNREAFILITVTNSTHLICLWQTCHHVQQTIIHPLTRLGRLNPCRFSKFIFRCQNIFTLNLTLNKLQSANSCKSLKKLNISNVFALCHYFLKFCSNFQARLLLDEGRSIDQGVQHKLKRFIISTVNTTLCAGGFSASAWYKVMKSRAGL